MKPMVATAALATLLGASALTGCASTTAPNPATATGTASELLGCDLSARVDAPVHEGTSEQEAIQALIDKQNAMRPGQYSIQQYEANTWLMFNNDTGWATLGTQQIDERTWGVAYERVCPSHDRQLEAAPA